MKKRGIFSIFSVILLLILMPNAFSIYEESVYSGTVEDRDIINISGHTFEFRIDPTSSKVYVEIDISAVIIESGECKIKDNFDICIGNVSFSHRDYTEWRDVYKAIIDVYQIKSTIGITNAIEKSKLLIDEETTAELTIENTADIVAKDVTATINIPSSLLVIDAEGCENAIDSIVFKDDVHPRQIKKCTYKLKGLTGDDFELTANVTYFDGIEKKSTTSSTISGKVYNYSLKINSEFNKSKFNILEKLNFTLNIENINDQYDLTITTLTIKIPEKLLLLKKPRDATGTDKIIFWSGTLTPKEKKSFVAELQSMITGNYSVLAEASYKVSKFSRNAKSVSNIEVYCDCPYLSHDFSQQVAVPEQRIGLKAFITNPSSVHSFSNVKLSYNTNIPNIQDFSTAYAKMNPLETIKIFDSPIITPPLNEVYHFNITAIYESPSNQVFVVKDKIKIRIPSVEEADMEEKIVEEQQEVKEEIEVEAQESEEVSSVTEKSEEGLDETEKKESKEEIPVTRIEVEEKKPFKALTAMAYIAGLVFILVVLIIFKRKRHEKAKEQKDINKKELKPEIDDGEKYNIKEFLSIIFRKKETMERKSEYKREEERTYKDIEKQIKKLGITPEIEKQGKKLGLFGRIFRKK